jgi:hypothetical protein
MADERSSGKITYSSPKLLVYGDIRRITAASANPGTKHDVPDSMGKRTH